MTGAAIALPEPPSSTTVAIIYLGLLTESTPTNHEVLFLSPEFCAVPVFPPTSLTLLPRIEKEACAVPPSLVTELRSLSKKLTKSSVTPIDSSDWLSLFLLIYG